MSNHCSWFGSIIGAPAVKQGISDTVKKQMQDAYAKQQKQNAQSNGVLNDVYKTADIIHEALLRKGIPDPGASYATYQTYFETAAYTNNGAKKYNNWSGIHWYNGIKRAKKGPNDYALFDDFNAWLDAFVIELMKGSKPATATSIEQFVTKLQQNKYFGKDNPAVYLDGLKRARLVLKSLPAADRAGTGKNPAWTVTDMDIPGSKYPDSANGFGDKLEKWAKDNPLLAVGAVLGTLLVVKKVIE